MLPLDIAADHGLRLHGQGCERWHAAKELLLVTTEDYIFPVLPHDRRMEAGGNSVGSHNMADPPGRKI